MAKHLDIEKIIEEQFASRIEAASFLGCCERSLDRWVKEGTGPPVTMIRRRQFFEREALAAFKKKSGKRALAGGAQ
jgi:hypothetical protein